MTIGIYRIDGPNSKVYIGSSTHIGNRWRKHRSQLNKNQHGNPKLQNAWNKYGKDAFKFSIVEIIEDASKLLYYEQIWLNILFTSLDERDEILNIVRFAGNTLGRKHTDESRRNISKGRRGVSPAPRTPEHLRKLYDLQIKRNIDRNGLYSLVSPEGRIYQEINNLSAFARQHNLQQANILAVIRRKRKHHKGWKIYEA